MTDTDAYGGTDAAVYTYTAAAGLVYGSLAAMTPGVPVWVEFDIKNPNDGNALDQLRVYVRDSNAAYHWRRVVKVPAVADGWVTYAFTFTPRTTGTSHNLFFSNADTGLLRSVLIGRPRVYHSNERVLGGRRPTIAAAATDPATTQTLVNDLRAKLICLGILG